MHHPAHCSHTYSATAFFNAFWAKVVAGSAAVALAYKFAPAPGKDQNLDYNLTNALLARQNADERLTYTHSRRPQILRMQAPQMLNNGSPFNMPVGLTVDLSEVQVKSD
ncbi:hypothetical protein CPB85DRAFT_1276442 [Mucidula mucida]|nr:hypothetical protein CPB85DRAFT_1276442 [Mucidula mucida]